MDCLTQELWTSSLYLVIFRRRTGEVARWLAGFLNIFKLFYWCELTNVKNITSKYLDQYVKLMTSRPQTQMAAEWDLHFHQDSAV